MAPALVVRLVLARMPSIGFALTLALTTALAALAAPSRALAQETVAQPGHEVAGQASAGGGATAGGRASPYEATAVVSPPPGSLREEQRIGDYAQPRWTSRRRFTTTRVYVRPAGSFGIEWWLELKQSLRDEHVARYRSQLELEIGLAHRLQLDLYVQTEQDGHEGQLELLAEKVELRWALANWGVIPLNPTLYVEYVRNDDGPPALELKALAGDELARALHFGLNLVWEHQLGDESSNEYALTAGLSYSLIDDVLALGLEAKLELVDLGANPFNFVSWELLAGPSLAWSPVPPVRVLFVPLFGLRRKGGMGGRATTGLFEPTVVIGWEA